MKISLTTVFALVACSYKYAAASEEMEYFASEEGGLGLRGSGSGSTSARRIQEDLEKYLALPDGYEWAQHREDCFKAKEETWEYKPEWFRTNDPSVGIKKCQETPGCVHPRQWQKKVDGKYAAGFQLYSKCQSISKELFVLIFLFRYCSCHSSTLIFRNYAILPVEGTESICYNFPVKKALPLRTGFAYTHDECKVVQTDKTRFLPILDPSEAWVDCEKSSECDYVGEATDDKGERGFNFYSKEHTA